MLKRENLKLPTCYVTYVLRHSPGEHQGAEFLLLKEESSTFQLIFKSWNCCEEIYGGFEGKGKKKKVCSHMHLHALLAELPCRRVEMPTLSLTPFRKPPRLETRVWGWNWRS